jgi:hypothetical protein
MAPLFFSSVSWPRLPSDAENSVPERVETVHHTFPNLVGPVPSLPLVKTADCSFDCPGYHHLTTTLINPATSHSPTVESVSLSPEDGNPELPFVLQILPLHSTMTRMTRMTPAPSGISHQQVLEPRHHLKRPRTLQGSSLRRKRRLGEQPEGEGEEEEELKGRAT